MYVGEPSTIWAPGIKIITSGLAAEDFPLPSSPGFLVATLCVLRTGPSVRKLAPPLTAPLTDFSASPESI